MIVVDSSVWINFFNGVSTPEVERLDGLLGVTPLVVGDLILVEVVQGFRHERDVATARRLFHAMALLPMLGVHNAWKTAENYRKLRSKGITVRKRSTGSLPRPAWRPSCRCCSAIVISCPTCNTWGWRRRDQRTGHRPGAGGLQWALIYSDPNGQMGFHGISKQARHAGWIADV